MANCKEIDYLSLRLLKLMNELMSCKVHLENATAEGFMYMAKSRILLGKGRVSILQLPLISEEAISPIYAVSRKTDSTDEFSLIDKRLQTCLVIEDTEQETAVSSNDEDMILTRRKTENVTKTPKNSDAQDIVSCEETERKLSIVEEKKIVDPLNWFGVLIPQELRMAQKSFKEAVSLAVDCANIQCKIATVMEKLERANLNIKEGQ